MANLVFVAFRVDFFGDGVSTTLDVDLANHPIFFNEFNGGIQQDLSNKFEANKPAPVAVGNLSGAASATISGSTVTFTLSAPVTGRSSISGDLHYS